MDANHQRSARLRNRVTAVLLRRGANPALFTYAHLCDVPAALPRPEVLRDEARGSRLYPGEGGLWLDDFVAAYPPGTPMAVEAPNALRTAAWPPEERARRAAEAARQLLRRHDGTGG